MAEQSDKAKRAVSGMSERPNQAEPLEYKSDFRSLSLFLLFWLATIVLGPMYIWTFILLVQWYTTLPFMIIYTPLKLQLFSLAIGCGFVPFAFLLRHWYQGTGDKNIVWIKLAYSVICLLSISLAVSAILLIDDYRNPSSVWTEYKALTDKTLTKGEFPAWGTDPFGTDCCGWNGPLDFGNEFNLTRFVVSGDKRMMDKVSECYNDMFEVTVNIGTTADDKLIFGPFRHISKLPLGCREKILSKTRETCYVIAFSSLVNILLTVLTLLLYIIPRPSCMNKKRRVIPKENFGNVKDIVTIEGSDGISKRIQISYFDEQDLRNANYLANDLELIII